LIWLYLLKSLTNGRSAIFIHLFSTRLNIRIVYSIYIQYVNTKNHRNKCWFVFFLDALYGVLPEFLVVKTLLWEIVYVNTHIHTRARTHIEPYCCVAWEIWKKKWFKKIYYYYLLWYFILWTQLVKDRCMRVKLLIFPFRMLADMFRICNS